MHFNQIVIIYVVSCFPRPSGKVLDNKPAESQKTFPDESDFASAIGTHCSDLDCFDLPVPQESFSSIPSFKRLSAHSKMSCVTVWADIHSFCNHFNWHTLAFRHFCAEILDTPSGDLSFGSEHLPRLHLMLIDCIVKDAVSTDEPASCPFHLLYKLLHGLDVLFWGVWPYLVLFILQGTSDHRNHPSVKRLASALQHPSGYNGLDVMSKLDCLECLFMTASCTSTLRNASNSIGLPHRICWLGKDSYFRDYHSFPQGILVCPNENDASPVDDMWVFYQGKESINLLCDSILQRGDLEADLVSAIQYCLAIKETSDDHERRDYGRFGDKKHSHRFFDEMASCGFEEENTMKSFCQKRSKHGNHCDRDSIHRDWWRPSKVTSEMNEKDAICIYDILPAPQTWPDAFRQIYATLENTIMRCFNLELLPGLEVLTLNDLQGEWVSGDYLLRVQGCELFFVEIASELKVSLLQYWPLNLDWSNLNRPVSKAM